VGPKRKRRGDLNLMDTTAGKDQALQAVQQGAGGRLPVYFPTKLTRGASFAQPPRVYKLKGRDRRRYGAYRMVVRRGLIGEFYGVQGTRWMDPPILAGPSEKRRSGHRTLEIHYDGDRVRLVAWRTKTAVYWVSNTLLQTLSERQMIAIAKSMRTL
jgi:polyisoprenyl-teichoic acid--peptidoglycan teichoic acid transferase